MYPLIGAIRFTPVSFTSLFSHAEKILSSFETVKVPFLTNEDKNHAFKASLKWSLNGSVCYPILKHRLLILTILTRAHNAHTLFPHIFHVGFPTLFTLFEYTTSPHFSRCYPHYSFNVGKYTKSVLPSKFERVHTFKLRNHYYSGCQTFLGFFLASSTIPRILETKYALGSFASRLLRHASDIA